MWLVDSNLDRAAGVRTTVYSNVDFAIHVRCEIQFCDVLRGYRFEPNGLPDAATGRVPDHAAAIQGLLSDGNLHPIHIRRVVDMDDKFVCPVRIQIPRNIHRKLKVAAPMESCVLPVYENRSFVVHCSKVQEHVIPAGPV
jgi:hypothetical protein